MKASNLRELARAVLEKAVSGDREELASAIAELLTRQAIEERRRCVAICRSRAELWRRTPAAHANVPTAREEARARANEAAYLADLIESDEIAAENGQEPN